MLNVWIYSLLSVLIVSLISLVGLFTISIKVTKLKVFLTYMIAFSAGALFGDAFIHLLPEIVKDSGFPLSTSLLILGGILIFFTLEKVVHWQHCHIPIGKDHVHPFAIMNLVGDGIHNFIDGLIIGASYLINFQVGLATTLAVALHEIPQEIGDFGVLLHGGFSRGKALAVNFLTALTAMLGAVVSLLASGYVGHVESYLIPIAIGGFIYIAGSDLIPELHKEGSLSKAIWQIVAFITGILIMVALLLIG